MIDFLTFDSRSLSFAIFVYILLYDEKFSVKCVCNFGKRYILKSFAKEWHIGDFSRVVCEFDGQEHEVKENKLKIYVLDIYFVFISFRLKY